MTDGSTAPEPPRRGRGRPSKGERKQFPLRLPVDLFDEIEAAAEAAGRSVNDEIERRCRATQGETMSTTTDQAATFQDMWGQVQVTGPEATARLSSGGYLTVEIPGEPDCHLGMAGSHTPAHARLSMAGWVLVGDWQDQRAASSWPASRTAPVRRRDEAADRAAAAATDAATDRVRTAFAVAGIPEWADHFQDPPGRERLSALPLGGYMPERGPSAAAAVAAYAQDLRDQVATVRGPQSFAARERLYQVLQGALWGADPDALYLAVHTAARDYAPARAMEILRPVRDEIAAVAKIAARPAE